MSIRETEITNQIRLALSKAGCITWRNECGVGWVGAAVHSAEGTTVLRSARRLTFGLMPGSSDLVGMTPDGRLLAVEVKTENGRKREKQKLFIDRVRAMGGRAGFARTVESALSIALGEPGAEAGD